MRVLVTGAAGLYGVHLVDALVKKDHISHVIGVDDFSRPFFDEDVFYHCPELHNKFGLIRGRFQDLTVEDLDALNLDAVVHLAAGISIPESMHKPEDYFFNNEYGTFKLLNGLLRTKNHPLLIYASSPEVYGNPQYVPMDINHPMNPRSIYAVTKLAAEKHCRAIHDWYGYPVIIIRNFNTFGENQNVEDYSPVIPSFIKNALLGEPLIVEGDGTQTRDFQYVKDAVQAYVLVLEDWKNLVGRIFNIGTGVQTSIADLAKMIVRLCDSSSEIIFRPGRPADLFSLEADISETTKLIGWKPKFTVEEGLKRTIPWFKKHLLQPSRGNNVPYQVVNLRHLNLQEPLAQKAFGLGFEQFGARQV